MVTESNSKKLVRLSWFFGVLAVIVLSIGIITTWTQLNKSSDISDQNNPASTTETPPDTNKPSNDAFDNHHANHDEPRYIFIPKISVRAMIKPVGVTPDNRVAAPSNVYDAGWYTSSAKPGQAGAMLIDGHVSSWETKGVFYNLSVLQANDTITIERGDGAILSYRVVKNVTYPADRVDMQAALSPINPAKPGLNLITCSGEIIEGTNQFDQRVVIFAEQL